MKTKVLIILTLLSLALNIFLLTSKNSNEIDGYLPFTSNYVEVYADSFNIEDDHIEVSFSTKFNEDIQEYIDNNYLKLDKIAIKTGVYFSNQLPSKTVVFNEDETIVDEYYTYGDQLVYLDKENNKYKTTIEKDKFTKEQWDEILQKKNDEDLKYERICFVLYEDEKEVEIYEAIIE